MPTVEERLQAIEQEHAALKKTIELQTIAIGALVNKAALEKLNEKYDRLFEVLIAHDDFTNKQLAELRTQQIETDGKITGLQTEMRQRFTEQDGKITGLQTEMRQRFTEQDGKITGLQTEMRQRFSTVEGRFDQIERRFTEQDRRFERIETILSRILERLPENP